WVSLRKSLIKQIQNDLKDYAGLERIVFDTYSGIGKHCPKLAPGSVAILDEAHTARNPGAKAGASAGKMVKESTMGMYVSATPWEDPSGMAYLEASGIFEPHGFDAFAMGYGAEPQRIVTPNGYGGARVTSKIEWTSSKSSLAAAAKGREFLVKRGIY